MMFKEFNSIQEYNEANEKCHKILSRFKNYNSPMYATRVPIETIRGTYLLPILERFKNHLPYEGKEIDKQNIKVYSFFI